MSIAVKIRRGTTAEHSAFTGLVGEITVDTTKKTVVVHDGATAGGVPLAKEASVGDISSLSTTEKGSVVGAVNELFTSVSDGKTLVAAAITDKGVETAATDSFSTMATNIGSIESGGAGANGTGAIVGVDILAYAVPSVSAVTAVSV